MTQTQRYTIGELADLAGVTPRTIRYYAAEGLLPPPDTRGRHALYNEDHLGRLQLIARLKEAYLPLGEIKARLDQLAPEQVQQLLADYSPAPEPVAPVSAAAYIAQVLTTQAAPPYQPPAAQADVAENASRASAAAPAPPMPTPVASPAPQPALQVGCAAPIAAPAAAQAPGGLLRKLVPQRRARENLAPSAATQPEQGEAWQRVTLAPGVELHLREPTRPDLQERIERLIALARELFRDKS